MKTVIVKTVLWSVFLFWIYKAGEIISSIIASKLALLQFKNSDSMFLVYQFYQSFSPWFFVGLVLIALSTYIGDIFKLIKHIKGE